MDKLDMVMRAMHGGVKPGHFKNTAGAETVQMPPPETVCIPMQQHIGAPCTPLVKKGDPVYLGQVIGDSDQPVSAPVHASVSGRVTGLGEVMLPGGQRVQTVRRQPLRYGVATCTRSLSKEGPAWKQSFRLASLQV